MTWMPSNLLKSDKTEIIVFRPKIRMDRLDHTITLEVIFVDSNSTVRNLGGSLQNTAKIRKILIQHVAEKPVRVEN